MNFSFLKKKLYFIIFHVKYFNTCIYIYNVYIVIYLLQELLEHREKDEVVKLVSTKSHGTTPLVIACRNGHYDVAEYLIEKCGANVNQPGLGKIIHYHVFYVYH